MNSIGVFKLPFPGKRTHWDITVSQRRTEFEPHHALWQQPEATAACPQPPLGPPDSDWTSWAWSRFPPTEQYGH